MNIAEMITVFFLGDAIRRFWIFYNKRKDLQKNDKVMLIHFILLSVYMISVLAKSVFVLYLIASNNYATKSVLGIGLVYTFDIWLQFFDQLIICYLVYTFIKPQQHR